VDDLVVWVPLLADTQFLALSRFLEGDVVVAISTAQGMIFEKYVTYFEVE
jgi:hypothetical protein